MGLNFSELIVILVIVLILFGPGKLPEIGKALGRGIRDLVMVGLFLRRQLKVLVPRGDSELDTPGQKQ